MSEEITVETIRLPLETMVAEFRTTADAYANLTVRDVWYDQMRDQFSIQVQARVATLQLEEYRYPQYSFWNYFKAALSLIRIKEWQPFKNLRVEYRQVDLVAICPKLSVLGKEVHFPALIPKTNMIDWDRWPFKD